MTDRRSTSESTRIDYRALAVHIAGIALHADCAALVRRLVEYPGAERLALQVVRDMQPTDSWFDGLTVLSAALQAENARFDRGLFEEWATEKL